MSGLEPDDMSGCQDLFSLGTAETKIKTHTHTQNECRTPEGNAIIAAQHVGNCACKACVGGQLSIGFCGPAQCLASCLLELAAGHCDNSALHEESSIIP